MSKEEDSVETLTKELTNFLLKAKGEMNRLRSENKEANDFKKASRTEYRRLYKENQKLSQKIK